MKQSPMLDVFQLWRDPSLLRDVVSAQTLASVRYEPIFRDLVGFGAVDLTFVAQERIAVTPLVIVDPMQLSALESSPFIWPQAIAEAVDHAVLLAIAARIEPWLRSLSRARPISWEMIRHYGDAQPFERARERGLLGAAPYGIAVTRMAPYVYAKRFARGAVVRIASTDGALAAAILRDAALRLFELPGHDVFERRWFGLTEAHDDPREPAEVLVCDAPDASESARVVVARDAFAGCREIAIPQPVPIDVLFTYDTADAPPVSRFFLRALALPPHRPVRLNVRPAAHGGSGGTIAFAIRPDGRNAPGADTDAIEELATLLRAEGFTVPIISDPNDATLATADLIHIFGGSTDPHLDAFARAALGRNLPYVVACEPPASETEWVEQTLPHAWRAGLHSAPVARILNIYANRRLVVENVPLGPSDAEKAAARATFSAVLAGARGVFAHSDTEIARLREELPFLASKPMSVFGPLLGPEPAEDDIAAIIPGGPFVLVHDAISVRSNMLFAIYAFAETNVPLVVAGDVYDVDVLRQLRLVASQRTIFVVNPTPGEVAALYRRATVWLDTSARPAGATRAVRALLCGAEPIVAATSPLAEIAGVKLRTFVLPDFASLRQTVTAALDEPARDVRVAAMASRFAPLADAAAALRSVINVYSQVGERV